MAPAEDAFGNHLTRLAIAVLVVMIAAWVGTDLLIRQNTDANKVLVRRLYDGFSTGGVDLLDEVVAEGFIDHDQCPTNPPDWLDSNRRLDRSGMHSRTERWWSKILWQRATVVARMFMAGTHRGEYAGLPERAAHQVGRGRDFSDSGRQDRRRLEPVCTSTGHHRVEGKRRDDRGPGRYRRTDLGPAAWSRTIRIAPRWPAVPRRTGLAVAINLNGIYGGRGAAPVREGRSAGPKLPGRFRRSGRDRSSVSRRSCAGCIAVTSTRMRATSPAVAYNALVALIPTLLLTLSVAGLFFRLDRVFETTIYSSFWGLPDSAAGDTIKTVLTARRSSSWLGVLSLAGLPGRGRRSSVASPGA